MDISNIPKTFWHSVSIAILVATIGLTIIAYRSASVSIEIANTKINLLAAIEKTEKLNETLRSNNSKLKKEYMELNNFIKSFNNFDKKKNGDSTNKQSGKHEAFEVQIPPQISNYDLKELIIPDDQFTSVEIDLKKLKENLK